MNLAIEPWIPVLQKGNGRILTSLTQIFREGGVYADLTVRPHERISLMRLFICIAQAALDGPKNLDEWETAPARLPERAESYLAKWHDAFDLFHPKKPFLQISGLKLAKEDPKKDGRTAVSKLDFALASGNSSTLFDHEASQEEHRAFPSATLALMLITYLNFSPGGLIAAVKWNKEITQNSSNDAPCVSSSMFHSFVRKKNLLDSIHANLLTRRTVRDLYNDKWGCPVWEKMPQSLNDTDAIENATTTYLGRLVPLPRFIRLDQDCQVMLLGNGLIYPGFPSIQREPSSTCITRKGNSKDNEERVLLGAKENSKEIWRELAALITKRYTGEQGGGAFTLLNVPESDDFDLYVGALLRKSGQADVLDTIESVFHIPAGMQTDIGRATYESEVEYAETVGKRLLMAVQSYFKHLNAVDTKTGKAAHDYWTAIEKLRSLLMAHVESIGLDATRVEESRSQWRKSVHQAAREAYTLACGQETSRQIRAFVIGWSLLFRDNGNSNDKASLSQAGLKTGKTKKGVTNDKEAQRG